MEADLGFPSKGEIEGIGIQGKVLCQVGTQRHTRVHFLLHPRGLGIRDSDADNELRTGIQKLACWTTRRGGATIASGEMYPE